MPHFSSFAKSSQKWVALPLMCDRTVKDNWTALKPPLVEDGNRGTTELACAPWPTFNFENCWPVMLAVPDGLEPVLEVFDLPAPYQPFNPVIQGQLSGDDFTNSSTRQEPVAGIRGCRSKAGIDRTGFSVVSFGPKNRAPPVVGNWAVIPAICCWNSSK